MSDKKINVLSLFNGMNTGRQALENVGIKVEKYYSSEIKPYAIELTQHHFPDTIQVGDVTKWKEWDIDWKSIDLVLSGSPCQDLSAAGKRAGINGKKSSLFFTFVEILEHIKSLNSSVLFLQENVGSASKLDVGIMSRALGVYPVRINSSLVTAQLRDRYYWSNIRTKEDGMFGDIITDIPYPKDKGILLNQILTSGKVDINKHTCLNTLSGSMGNSKQEYLTHRNETTGMITLIKEGDIYRTCNKIEMCRLQGFPDDYCDILNDRKAGSLLESNSRPLKTPYKMAKRYFDIGMANLIFKDEQTFLRVKEATTIGFVDIAENEAVDLSYPTSTTRRGRQMKDKSNCLLRNNEYFVFQDNDIRYFTQTELERLQGFQEGYTSILSRNQAACLLGDGWTLPVIEHIFSFIKL